MMKLHLLVRLFCALLISLPLASGAFAQDCRRTQSVCVDGPSTKDVNGVSVTRACWKYTDTYDCIAPSSVDYCSAIREVPGCVQSGSECVRRAFNNECLEFANTYRCDQSIAPPANVLQLTTTYTITTDQEDRSQCANQENNPRCSLAQRLCTEPGGTRTINGLEVSRDCWAWEEQYACVSMENDCQAMSDNEACTLVSTECEDRNSDGSCALSALTYTCRTGAADGSEVTTCNGGTFCINGLCFDQPVGNDRDFSAAVTMMEAGRQAAGYATGGEFMRIFSGTSQQCSRNPLANCCKTNARGADKTNGAMISTVMQAGRQAWGSWYVYDTLDSTLRQTNAIGALYSRFAGLGAGQQAFMPSGVSYYGVTFNPFVTGGGNMFAFDPTSFAVSVAIALLQELLACEQEEEVLAMQRGQNLCSYVGSYCSQKFLGSCVSRKSSYCCFNSKLARIVQEQGRAQLGLNWGSAEAPNCTGLTLEQFQQVDFSSIDFSEFIEDISRNVKMPDVEGIQNKNQQRIQERVENYFNQ